MTYHDVFSTLLPLFNELKTNSLAQSIGSKGSKMISNTHFTSFCFLYFQFAYFRTFCIYSNCKCLSSTAESPLNDYSNEIERKWLNIVFCVLFLFFYFSSLPDQSV